MYAFIRQAQSRAAVLSEAVSFAVALAVAETFYKFHSFSLECLAFLATWLALSALIHFGQRWRGKNEGS